MAGEVIEIRVLTERRIGPENSELGSRSRLQFRTVDAYGRIKEWRDVEHTVVNTYVEHGKIINHDEKHEPQFWLKDDA